MARSWFGGSSNDVATEATAGALLRVVPGAVITLWSAQTGGSQYTDLLLDAVAVESITADASGLFPRFQGPDSVPEMWADSGGTRVLMATPRRITVGSSAPAAPVLNDVWIDTT